MSCPKCQPVSRRRWPVFLILIAAVVLATAALAEPSALGLGEAGRLAVEQQPRLAAREAGIAALREEAVAASQLPDPKLILGVEGVPVDNFSLTRETMTQTVIGISQRLPNARRRALAGQRLEHAALRDDIALETERRRLMRETGLAWLDVYAAESERTLVHALEAEYRRQEDWNRIAYTTGQIDQDNTLSARVALASTGNRLTALDSRTRQARATLTRWLGGAGERPLAAMEPLPAPDFATLAGRLDQHPELRAEQAGIELGQVDSDLARQAYRPDLSLDFSYGIRGEGRTDTLKLMLGVDLPLFPERRQDRRLAARQAELQALEAGRADRRRALAAELAAADADWRGADARLTRLDADILPLARQRVASALAAYETGRAGYDRVLDARRAELDIRLERLGLEVARARAAVRLAYFE